MHWTILGGLIFLLTASAADAFPVFVCQQPDGNVTITVPAQKSRRVGEAEDAFLQRTLARAREANPSIRDLPCQQADSKDLPQDRTKRHAWRLKDGKVVVDPTVPDPPKRVRP